MTYAYRMIECPDCWDGNYEIASGPGYVTCRCDTCNGEAEIEATCAECCKHEPLNDEGLCELCHDKNELSVAEFNAKHSILNLTAEKLSDPLKRRAA
jgi:RecJ-like exonuclease